MKKHTSSIQRNLKASYAIIICVLMIPAVYSIATLRFHSKRYDMIIANASLANQLRNMTKTDILNEIWNVVAGLTSVNEGKQYIMLRKVRIGITQMQKAENGRKAQELLSVAFRAEKTLEKYVAMLEMQIYSRSSVSETQQTMEQIRGVASLLDDVLEEFIMMEIESAENVNHRIHGASVFLSVLQIIVSVIAVLVAVYASALLYKTIRISIGNMEKHSSRIASGELSARVERPNILELDNLAENLNIMASRIQDLINENIREQKNLQKAEMKTLQAQITPHFLYNTFDTIIWLAEEDETEEVIEVTKAFSSFFRISLSRGHDWITLSQEIEHVTSYLKIQRIRYRNILDYEIACDEGIGEMPILKLLLQPLVENAIYHGIKNKRGRGKIVVRAQKAAQNGEEKIRLSVEDNGIGFLPERLNEVRQEIRSRERAEDLKSVYGLYNVSKRLELYYGNNVQLNIESEYGNGTAVWFEIPFAAGKSEVEIV